MSNWYEYQGKYGNIVCNGKEFFAYLPNGLPVLSTGPFRDVKDAMKALKKADKPTKQKAN